MGVGLKKKKSAWEPLGAPKRWSSSSKSFGKEDGSELMDDGGSLRPRPLCLSNILNVVWLLKYCLSFKREETEIGRQLILEELECSWMGALRELAFLNLTEGNSHIALSFTLMIENLLKRFEAVFLFLLNPGELTRSLDNFPGLRSTFWIISQKLRHFSKG